MTHTPHINGRIQIRIAAAAIGALGLTSPIAGVVHDGLEFFVAIWDGKQYALEAISILFVAFVLSFLVLLFGVVEEHLAAIRKELRYLRSKIKPGRK